MLTTVFKQVQKINSELEKQGKASDRILVNERDLTDVQKTVLSRLKDQYGLMQKLEALGDDQIAKEKLMNEFAEKAASILEQREKNLTRYMTNMERANHNAEAAEIAYRHAQEARIEALNELADKQTDIDENAKDRIQTENKIKSLQVESLRNQAQINALDAQKNSLDARKQQNLKNILSLQQQIDSGNVADDERGALQ